MIREPDNFYAALEGWEPILSKEGKVMGYKTKPLVESLMQRLADPESVKPVENPEPAADPESATDVTLQPVDSTG